MNNDNAVLLKDYISFDCISDDIALSVIGELFLKLFSSSSEIRIISDLFNIEVVAIMKSPYAKHSRFFRKHGNPNYDSLVVASGMSRIANPNRGSTIFSDMDYRNVLEIPIFHNDICIGYVMCGMFFLSREHAKNSNRYYVIDAEQVTVMCRNVSRCGTDILKSCFKYIRKETEALYYDAKMLFNYGSFYDYNIINDTFILSRQTTDIFGWDYRDHYTYSDFMSAVVEHDRQRVAVFMRNNIFLGNGDYVLYTTIQRPHDGKLVELEISGSIIKDSNGYSVRTLGSISDVTILKDMQAKLRDEIDNKNRLIRIIGHDLKNPFNGLIGFSELLSTSIQQRDYDEAIEFAQIINQSAVEGYDLLVNLLDYSQSQSSNLKADLHSFELCHIVDSIIRLCSAQASKKGISIQNNIPPCTMIYSDEYMISTVLRNLISNAIKFCYKEGVVAVDVVCTSDSVARVSVSDTGVMIPEEKLALINKSRSVESTRGTAQEKGTSIGLKMCHSFLNVLGSRLEASSDEAITVFCFDVSMDKSK